MDEQDRLAERFEENRNHLRAVASLPEPVVSHGDTTGPEQGRSWPRGSGWRCW